MPRLLRWHPAKEFLDRAGTVPKHRRGWSAKHHTAEHANAKHVYPAKREFQQVGIEYARQDILDDHTDPEPGRQSGASEQQEVRYPQPKQQCRAHEAQLNGDLERLIMRLVGCGRGCPRAFARKLAKSVEDG